MTFSKCKCQRLGSQSLMYFCCIPGLPTHPHPQKIFQDVWNANKALFGSSFSTSVKYLVWKLFQYLNEVCFCRGISHDKKKNLYKGSVVSRECPLRHEVVCNTEVPDFCVSAKGVLSIFLKAATCSGTPGLSVAKSMLAELAFLQ